MFKYYLIYLFVLPGLLATKPDDDNNPNCSAPIASRQRVFLCADGYQSIRLATGDSSSDPPVWICCIQEW